MNKPKTTMAALVLIVLVTLGWNLFIHQQNSSKNTIRVLVDRLPHQLKKGQPVDIAAKRILPLLDSGFYRIHFFDPQSSLVLMPAFPRGFDRSIPNLEFIYIQDEISRSLAFERGDAEVGYNSLNIEKTNWVMQNSRGSRLITEPGFHLSFLGFNVKQPELKSIEVRKHLAMAIPINEWAVEKWKNWVVPIEHHHFPEYNPERSKKFFSHHPLPTLRYLTTSVREGFETAHMVREALNKVGVQVEIMIVDATLFFTRIKQGEFSIFSSRFIRTSDSEPIQNYVKSDSEKNYFGYSNPKVDEYILKHQNAAFQELRPWLEQDLPFLPMYNWKHCLIINNQVRFRDEKTPILDESFRFLIDLELKYTQ